MNTVFQTRVIELEFSSGYSRNPLFVGLVELRAMCYTKHQLFSPAISNPISDDRVPSFSLFCLFSALQGKRSILNFFFLLSICLLHIILVNLRYMQDLRITTIIVYLQRRPYRQYAYYVNYNSLRLLKLKIEGQTIETDKLIQKSQNWNQNSP